MLGCPGGRVRRPPLSFPPGGEEKARRVGAEVERPRLFERYERGIGRMADSGGIKPQLYGLRCRIACRTLADSPLAGADFPKMEGAGKSNCALFPPG